MIRDVFVVGPILIVGGFLLNSLSLSVSRHEHLRGEELVFLAFLHVLLFVWYRSKQVAAERLRALELGRELPERVALWPVGKVIATVAIGTPLVAFGVLAWIVSSSPHRESPAVWIMATLVGITGLVCGTIVLLNLSAPTSARHSVPFKPTTDPDAFDVVGQRASNGFHTEERS